MRKKGYYSSGEFARMAHVTLRAIRYYDKHDILKPSFVTGSGARFYTDQDFAKLQQILLLKYLGFSLNDIQEMTISDMDVHFMINSMKIQLKLVRDKIEQMQSVEKAILDITNVMQTETVPDWNQMLNLIHLTGMETSLRKQYQDASNITDRINLHQLYSKNQQGWFPWLFEQCKISPNMRILEIGCGDGTLWTNNISNIPETIEIILSDISDGMLRDARRAVGTDDQRFDFKTFDCKEIPYADNSFDVVIANHVLFYCDNISQVCREVRRILRPKGHFICSTYGSDHMKEVSQLVRAFDERIVLSANRLYKKFGRENGKLLLKDFFSLCEWREYEDSLLVTDHDPLISYILSCHGNQKQYITDHYREFRKHVKKKTSKGFHITKDAGIFFCKK